MASTRENSSHSNSKRMQVDTIFTSRRICIYTSSLYLWHNTLLSAGISCKEQYMAVDILICRCFLESLDMLFSGNGDRNGQLLACVALQGQCSDVWSSIHLQNSVGWWLLDNSNITTRTTYGDIPWRIMTLAVVGLEWLELQDYESNLTMMLRRNTPSQCWCE